MTHLPPESVRPPCRRGTAMLWATLVLVPLSAIISLALDFGHAQLVRTQMQNSADAIALGVMNAYITGGMAGASTASAVYPADNTVDAGSGVTPTCVVTGGTWSTGTRVFTPNGTVGTPAVRVQLSRTQAAGNAVKVVWGGLIGRRLVDVRVTAIAVQGGGTSGNFSIPSQASLHLAGMPNGTTTVWGDDVADAPPYKMTSIPVTPGHWLTFSNFSGNSSIYPAGGVGYYGASGNSAMPLHHGQNYNSVPNNPGNENGIADAVIYASAVTGLFLSDDQPSENAPPATVDWTQSAQVNRTSYNDLQIQQPFMIGDGKNNLGLTQKFQVPPNATRMYLSVWDGVQQNNNGGTVSGTVTSKLYSYLAR